jgi:uncharacterized damage-inducible protein DinB
MEMKQYLLDTFMYNDHANKMVLVKMREMRDPAEAIRLFSHLINSQYKWMARIVRDPNAPAMDWWEPLYASGDLEEKWNDSLRIWTAYIGERSEEQMYEEKQFVGFDGGEWTAPLKDIALQLNYHSIHHRAQIQSLIRAEGIEPDFVDYIGTVYRKLS